MMNDIIILNLKSVFLPEYIAQNSDNQKFLENSLSKSKKYIPTFDSFAVREIQKMVDITKAKIVSTDNWFWTSDMNITKFWCEKNGLNLTFHKNYVTPKKMSSLRINEVHWWIKENPFENVILILDEDKTMLNLKIKAKEEECFNLNYKLKYNKYIGNKRRESLIPRTEYIKYEEYKKFYGVEVDKTVNIDDINGINTDIIELSWKIIKQETM